MAVRGRLSAGDVRNARRCGLTGTPKDDWLEVAIKVYVRLGPDSMEEWPEERCEAKAREIWQDVNADYTVGEKYEWRVTE